MYRIAICDDERAWREKIELLINDYCNRNNIDVQLGIFPENSQLVECIKRGCQFDAYILDVEMKPYSGIELAKHIRQYSKYGFIVYLTAHANYAVEGYGVNVLRYILKENVNTALVEALQEIFTYLERDEQKADYLIENQRKYLKINQRDIVRIYKNQKNAVFVLNNGREEYERNSLKNVYRKLNSKDMVFFDKGMILNLNHVFSISKEKITLDNGYEIGANEKRILEMKKRISKKGAEQQ
jgi:DNA-binding LytR/AlgR family response regulator